LLKPWRSSRSKNIGSDNQIRVTTKYLIMKIQAEADRIGRKLNEGLKPVFKKDIFYRFSSFF
jgi:hypothetical protein